MSDRFALIIGIEEYADSHLGRLSKTVAGADKFEELLIRHGNCYPNQITKLVGEVSYKDLIAELGRFLREKAVSQEAILYFAGHGILETETDDLTNETTKKGYLAPSDCQLSGKDQVRKAIPLDSLATLIGQTSLSSLTVILDTCHSGALMDEIKQQFGSFHKGTKYNFIVSCRDYEQAWARKSKDYTEFTGALIEALQRDQANEEGTISVGRAFEKTKKVLQASRQIPEHIGDAVDYPLLLYAPEIVSTAAITLNRSNIIELTLPLTEVHALILSKVTRNLIKAISPQTHVRCRELNHNSVLVVGQVLQLLQRDFPQFNGIPSLILLAQQLSQHPEVINQAAFRQWLAQFPVPDVSIPSVPDVCSSYLMVILKPQGSSFGIKGVLWKDLDTTFPVSLALRDDQPTEDCSLAEVPEKVAKLLALAQNQYLRDLLSYDLTLEIRLPFDYLTETVDLWAVPDPLGDLRPLGQDYRLVVSCYERFHIPPLRNTLKSGWQRWQQSLQQPQNILQRVAYWEAPQAGLSPEAIARDKIALTCTLPQTNTDDCTDLFKAIIRTGVPLTLWCRRDQFDSQQEFQDFLRLELLQNWQTLIQELHEKRQVAHCQPQPSQTWIYHVAAWLDNPDLLTELSKRAEL